MMTVWYLVIVLNSGTPGHQKHVAFTIPQINQAVCVRNKLYEQKRPEVKAAYCKKGALPRP